MKNGDKNSIVFQVVIPRGDSEKVHEWILPYLRKKDITFSNTSSRHSVNYSKVNGQLRPLVKYEKINYSGLVYDLTVEEDLTYIVHGISVFDCPDFRYRWAYNDAKMGASVTGPTSLSGNNGNPPRTKNTDLGPGLCKHLLSLGEYLRTKWEPTAPEPPDETPSQPLPIKNPIKTPTKSIPSQPSQLGNAPEPPKKPKQSYYSDSRAGDLMEQKSKIVDVINSFVQSNPQFEVPYED